MFKNKISVVTGASRGIGEATADLLEVNGAIVFRVSRTEGYKCDVSDPLQIENTVQKIVSKYDKIDFLINCAGVMNLLPIGETTLEDWQYIMNTNLQSVF